METSIPLKFIQRGFIITGSYPAIHKKHIDVFVGPANMSKSVYISNEFPQVDNKFMWNVALY